MAWPSNSSRTKNWGNEILTDSDLEGQLDILHTYITDMMNATTGHDHSGTANDGPQIPTAGIVDDAVTPAKLDNDGAFVVDGTWDFTSAVLLGESPLVFEGATANAFETTFTFTDPTADRTVTFPNESINFTSYTERATKGWINFNGSGTIAINDSFNVSGIVDNGAGDWTVTWDTDFASANYACVGSVQGTNGTSGAGGYFYGYKLATGSARVNAIDGSATLLDSASISVIAVGDQ